MDFGHLFRNRMNSVPFELEFRILIPGTCLPEQSQKALSINVALKKQVSHVSLRSVKNF